MGRATKPQTFCLYTFLIAIMLSSFTYGKGIYVDVNVAGEDVVPHIQWSQPPVEIDPNVDVPPVFFGWSEPARSTEYTGSKRQ